MAKRKATANWNGGLKGGDGTMALGSGAFEGAYSFKSRFEEGTGTNPEELIGAAIAGCYSMQLSAFLERDGVNSESVQTEATVDLGRTDAGPTITTITLATTANVPGGDEEQVRRIADEAKQACLIARALAGVETIEVDLTVNA
jgi:osmotically inducible protein OsmC